MEVSVVIPIYNREKYLRECLESVINQDCSAYEVILINDGSTDSSEDICKEYLSNYSYFRYFYQENEGPGIARNVGLANAQGKYIFFIDSDDVLQKNSLRKLVEFAKEKDADVVYFDEIVCDENLAVQSVAKTYQDMNIQISKLKALEFSMHPAHICARLWRRNLFDEIQFTNIWYEDMEIFPRLIAKAKTLYYYKVPIYYYRQHKEEITYQEEDERNFDVITAWRNAYIMVDWTEEEKNAVEISIKKSIVSFIIFRPKYAVAYAKFYNQFFLKEINVNSKKNCGDQIDVKSMPLWQQADFYGESYILDILTGLKNIYRYGGELQFHGNKKVKFQKKDVQIELVAFSVDKGTVFLEKVKTQKGNEAVLEVLKDCSQWNLISLKNKMKEFKIAEIILEKAILNGIRIEWRS